MAQIFSIKHKTLSDYIVGKMIKIFPSKTQTIYFKEIVMISINYLLFNYNIIKFITQLLSEFRVLLPANLVKNIFNEYTFLYLAKSAQINLTM
jgi:hypothetical protein